MQTGRTTTRGLPEALNLRVGDVVEVRGVEEILATIDENGELDALPFMPEMAAFCGQRMTVYKVAHKLCDTIERTGMRRMERAVHLTHARCDGSAHGGCQTGCLLYWKEAWLRHVDADAPAPATPAADAPPPATPNAGAPAAPAPPPGRATLPLLDAASRRPPGPDGEPRYSCQATELLRAAPDRLPLREMGQYVQDVRTGNATPREVVVAFGVGVFNRLQGLSRKVLPPRLLFRAGRNWRFLHGTAARPTPNVRLDLQPGELVRVRSREEILATVDENLLNRGMGFQEEMERYCGQVRRVVRRVDRCIDERTGRMLRMTYPCIVLEDDVICAGAYAASCPRAFVPFWREAWLERVEPRG